MSTDEARPVWKNPFALAFVVGLVVLTALPFMQRRFLKAPPPVRTLARWELSTLSGRTIGSRLLTGRVWLVSVVPSVCDAECLQRVESFGRGLSHTDDLARQVMLISVVQGGAVAQVRSFSSGADSRWQLVTGTPAELAPLLGELRAAWLDWAHTDAGSTDDEFARVPAIGLVDQNGAARGFWRDDTAGRGNAINAARLLSQYGPTP